VANPVPRQVADIDWASFRAKDRATLIFVVRDGEILLIRKKRGLGAGKINGPGGKLEPGETPAECALREIEEELGVRATGAVERGQHRFQFVDGYSIHVHVFIAFGCEGTAVETDEAVPLWTALEKIPYDEMWEDDEIWLPHVLAGRSVTGRWIFDDDRMVDYALEIATD
jgi:8-oxo-dGTP diphosphatase